MKVKVTIKRKGGIEKWYKRQIIDKFPSIQELTCRTCSGKLVRVDKDNFKCSNSSCPATAYFEVAEKE